MNALDLPAREPLPPEVRDRIRQTVENGAGAAVGGSSRPRAPLAVAAGVAVLALGAAIVAQSVAGTPDGFVPGATPPTSTTSTTSTASGKGVPSGAAIPPVTTAQPNAQTTADLDRCGDVAAASPRAPEFAPRAEWTPVFTATAPDGTRITAFRQHGDTPAFCEITATTVTVSDPKAVTMSIASGTIGGKPVDVDALYISPAGLVAGVARGASSLEFAVYRDGAVHSAAHTVVDGLFVVNLGELSDNDGIEAIGRDDDGTTAASGVLVYDSPAVPEVGATGPR